MFRYKVKISETNEGNEAPILGNILFFLYGRSGISRRKFILSLVKKVEQGSFCSVTLRRIFSTYHDIHIGMYTHGGCFQYGAVGEHTEIGRYCSIADPVSIINDNHPLNLKSTHGIFFNPYFHICDRDFSEITPLTIGNDVWLGRHSTILPNVKKIGDGVVIGAGAVVHKNIPPYAVVVGQPARIVRYRFPKEIIKELLESKWWKKSLEELRPSLSDFFEPYEKIYDSRPG